MIDIHSHILPGVDDGPDSIEEAEILLREAYKQGVRYLILTPHFRPEMFEPSSHRVLSSYKKLRLIAKDIGIGLRLGCECYRHPEMIAALKNRELITLAKSRYVLVEFSGHDLFSTIRGYVYELICNGYRPIIAHAERYVACESFDNLRELREMGALIQVNADSILGEDGLTLKLQCARMMKADLIDFIASDTHNMDSRKMNLKKCYSYVKRKMGKDYAKRLFRENPAEILKDRVNDTNGKN